MTEKQHFISVFMYRADFFSFSHFVFFLLEFPNSSGLLNDSLGRQAVCLEIAVDTVTSEPPVRLRVGGGASEGNEVL